MQLVKNACARFKADGNKIRECSTGNKRTTKIAFRKLIPTAARIFIPNPPDRNRLAQRLAACSDCSRYFPKESKLRCQRMNCTLKKSAAMCAYK